MAMLHPQLQQLEQQFSESSLIFLDEPLFAQHQMEVWVKRDDLLHPIISGNKWRKLKYILQHVFELKKDTLISMGGAYSNHLHALAYTGHCLGLKTRAYIRGEKPAKLNSTLKDLLAWGMELKFISRSEYRVLRTQPQSVFDLKPNEYWLPEGGASRLALQGVVEIIAEIPDEFDVLCSACGTGTTLAGLIEASPLSRQILGIAALKNADFLYQDIQALLPENQTVAEWQLDLNHHFGGFAQVKPELLNFITTFENQHNIPLEPVYTGKMFYALYDLITQGYFKKDSKIIVLHTGGLQGKRGFNFV